MKLRRFTTWTVLGIALVALLGNGGNAQDEPDRSANEEWPEWMPPVEIGIHGTDFADKLPADMRLAMDSRGRVHAVWVEMETDFEPLPPPSSAAGPNFRLMLLHIYHSMHDWATRDNNGWRPKALVHIERVYAFAGLDFAIDPLDRLHVVFSIHRQRIERRFDEQSGQIIEVTLPQEVALGDQVFYTSSEGGIVWTTPQGVVTPFVVASRRGFEPGGLDHDARGFGRPRLVVQPVPSGPPLLHVGFVASVLLERHNPVPHVFDHYGNDACYVVGDGEQWSPLQNISRKGSLFARFADEAYQENAFGEAFPFLAEGNAGLAWSTLTPNGALATVHHLYAPRLQGSSIVPGSEWTVPDGIAPLGDVKGDGGARVDFVWKRSGGTEIEHWRLGGAQSTVASADPGALASVVANSRGEAQVVWTQASVVFHSSALAAGGWSNPRQVTFDEGIAPRAVHTVADGLDTLHVGYSGALGSVGQTRRHLRTWEDHLGAEDALGSFPMAPGAVADVTTGNLSFALPLFGSSGVGLSASVSIVYNSMETQRNVMSSGWQTNYHMYITELAARTFAERQNPDIALTLGDGRSIVFRWRPEFAYYVALPESGFSAAIFFDPTDNLFDMDAPPGVPIRWMMVTKHGMKYFFVRLGKVHRIADTNRNVMDFEYENFGGSLGYEERVLTRITDTAGRLTRFGYDAELRVSQVEDPARGVYRLAYAPDRRLASVTFGATGDTWQMEHYPGGKPGGGARSGLLSTIRTPRGAAAKTQYGHQLFYTPTSRIVRSVDPAPFSYERRIAYVDGTDPTATFRNRRGFETVVTYERRRAVVLSVRNALGNTLSREFDGFRNVTSVRDWRGNQTSSTFYVSGFAHVMDNLASVARPGLPPVEYTYTNDGLNRVRTVRDARGATTTNEYDAFGNLRFVTLPPTTDNPVAMQTYEYDGRGRLLTSLEPGNATPTGYGYGGLDGGTGLATSITRPGLPAERIEYDAMGNITKRTAPEGGDTTYGLDGLYRVVLVTGPKGTDGASSTATTYDADGNVASMTVAGVGVTNHQYDELGRVTSTTLPSGGVSSNVDIDEEGNVKASEDPNGNVTFSQYDELGRVAFIDPPESGSTRFAYDENGNVLEERESAPGGGVRTTTSAYDARNNLVRREHPAAGGVVFVDTMAYDANDNVVSSERSGGGFSRGMSSQLDERNRVTRATEFGGLGVPDRSSEFDYAPNSNRTRVRDGLGRETTYGFDEANRMTSVTDPTRGLTRFFHDGNGNRTGVEVDGPNGGRLLTQTMRYNQANQLVETEDAGGHVTRQFYDIVGRLRRREGPLGPSPQVVVEYVYYGPGVQGAGQLRFQVEKPGGGLPDAVTGYEYDRNGNRTVVIDPRGNRYEYRFDARNRLREIVYPAGTQGPTSESVEYDELGNVFARVDANGRRHEFDHDGLNRVVEERHFESQSHPENPGGLQEHIVRSYDGAGNELSVENLFTGIRKDTQFNAFNQPTRVDWYMFGVVWKSIEYPVYDDAGNRRQTIGPEGEVFDYTFDDSNRMTRMTRTAPGGTADLVAEWEYDRSGRKRRMGLGNGVQAWYNYSEEELLTGLRYERGGKVLASWTYTHDQNHNRVGQVMDHLGASWTYTHDGMQRLLAEGCTGAGVGVAPPPDPTVTRPEPPGNQSADSAEVEGIPQAPLSIPTYSSSWTYDGVGNRLTKRSTLHGDSNYEYSDANELTVEHVLGADAHDIAFTYDRVGAVAMREESGQIDRFQTDYANRITLVSSMVGGGTFSYLYAPTGERLAKFRQGRGQEEWFMYDGADVITDYFPDFRGDLQPAQAYATGPGIDDQIGGWIPDPGALASPSPPVIPFYYLADALGSVHATTREGGSLDERQILDAWGQRVFNRAGISSPTANIGRYSGLAQREMDNESGLQYTRARHYDPRIGRFVQRDPAGDLSVFQHYKYAKNSPLMVTDSSGAIPEIDYSNAPAHIKTNPAAQMQVVDHATKAAAAYGANIQWTEDWRRKGFGEEGTITLKGYPLVRLEWGHPVGGEHVEAVTTGNKGGYNVLINVNQNIPSIPLLVHEFAHLYQYQKGYANPATIFINEQLKQGSYNFGGLPSNVVNAAGQTVGHGRQSEGLRAQVKKDPTVSFASLSSSNHAEEAASIVEVYWTITNPPYNGINTSPATVQRTWDSTVTTKADVENFVQRLEHFTAGVFPGVSHTHNAAKEE